MNSPKHLWSGDWERHSTEPPAEPERAPAPPPASPEPAPDSSDSTTAGWRSRQTAIFSGVIVVLVIVGVALAFSLGGSSKKSPTQQAQVQSQPFGNSGSSSGGGSIFPTQSVPQSTTPQSSPGVAPVQTQTTAAPVTVGPTYTWLGTEIIDSSTGVTVETINIGSAADTAGVNPGDVIQAVNGTEIGSVAELQKAAAALKVGQSFTLTVDRGTTQVTLTATLTDRPVKQ